MTDKKLLQRLVSQARQAQKSMENYSQAEVDLCVKAIAKVIYDNADLLANEAVEETGMGVYEDKVARLKGNRE